MVIQRCLFFLPHSLLDKLITILENFAEGIKIIKRPSILLQSLLFTYIFWLLQAICVAIVLAASGFSENDLFQNLNSNYPLIWIALFLLSLIAVISFIPSAPGGVGPYQAVCVLTLSLFIQDVNNPSTIAFGKAVSFSMILWLRQILPMIFVGGLITFVRHWRKNY